MKKLTVVTIVICLLLSLAGCGSSDTSALEKRLDALEEENARMAEQLESIAKRLGIPSESKSSVESQAVNTSQAIEETDGQSHNGFYPDPTEYPEHYSYYVYLYDSPQGSRKTLEINLAKDWKVVEAGNKLVLELDKGWIEIALTIEIDPTISSAPECEKKIREITSSFQSEGVGEEYVRSYGFPQMFRDYITGQSELKGTTGGDVNLDDTWWFKTIMNDRGASYTREKSTHTLKTSEWGNTEVSELVFSLLKSEAYLYLPENQLGALHVTEEVISFDFQGYYNSRETTIEKNEAREQFDSFNFFWMCNGSGPGDDLRYLLTENAKVQANK